MKSSLYIAYQIVAIYTKNYLRMLCRPPKPFFVSSYAAYASFSDKLTRMFGIKVVKFRLDLSRCRGLVHVNTC